MNQLPNFPTPKRLAIKLRPAAEKAVKQGHPWVFEKGIVKRNQEGLAGDLAIIFDQKKNKLLAIGLWDPASPIRIKILHLGKGKPINEDFFREKIEIAFHIRQPLLATDTNSYRLLYGENDGFPGLVFDIYAGVGVLKLYSPIWGPYLETLLPILIELSGIQQLVLRLARNLQQWPAWPSQLSDGLVLYGDLESPTVIFREHGLRFSANIIKGHKTGYFLDHRHNRHQINQLAEGKRVLDVFAYAGGFSVHALAGGAKQVTSIDISNQALEMAIANANLNFKNPPLTTIAIDAFEGLIKLKDERQRFDIVVIDPPSFAKSADEIPGALQSYERLIRAAIPLVEKGGLLLSCSCSSRVSHTVFFDLNEKVLQNSGRSFQEWKRTQHDIDHPISFPEGAYLKSIYYKIF